MRILKNPIFGIIMVELLPARFQGPFKKWVLLFLAFFSSCFSVSSASSKRVLKKTYFHRVFAHPLLKHLVTSCSNNEVKPNPPPKKAVHIFFGTPFLTIFSKKNTHFAPPPENCAQTSQKTYFYRLKKRWPSYSP